MRCYNKKGIQRLHNKLTFSILQKCYNLCSAEVSLCAQWQRKYWRELEFLDFSWIVRLKETLSTRSYSNFIPLWSWSPFTPIIPRRAQNLERWVSCNWPMETWINCMKLRETIGEKILETTYKRGVCEHVCMHAYMLNSIYGYIVWRLTKA